MPDLAPFAVGLLDFELVDDVLGLVPPSSCQRFLGVEVRGKDVTDVV